MSELDQGVKGSGKDLSDVVDEVLQSDDKLLSSLQKLGWELETEGSEETESVGQLREICARLIKYTVECIRTKLDRSYLENLESFSKSEPDNQAPKEELAALQEEVDSLYSEILPVAQMSVEQQWLEPSLRSLSAKSGQGLSHAAGAIQYVSLSVLAWSGQSSQKPDPYSDRRDTDSRLLGPPSGSNRTGFRPCYVFQSTRERDRCRHGHRKG